jgi:hypothetical protein
MLARAAACAALLAGCNAIFGVSGLSYDVRDASATSGAGGAPCKLTPAVPDGWEGPLALYIGGDTPPECGSSWKAYADGGTEPAFATTGCTCFCSKPVGYACLTATPTTYFEAAACNASTTSHPTMPDGTCAAQSLTSILSVKAAPTVPAGGMCSASQEPLVGAGWKAFARVCAAPAGSCPVPDAPPGFSHDKCIASASVSDCPAEFPVKNVMHRGLSDTRKCAECTCGTPKGVECQTKIGMFPDALCSAPPVLVLADGACHDISSTNIGSHRIFIDPIPGSGSCQIQGGAVESGTVTATEPLTVCCTK